MFPFPLECKPQEDRNLLFIFFTDVSQAHLEQCLEHTGSMCVEWQSGITHKPHTKWVGTPILTWSN